MVIALMNKKTWQNQRERLTLQQWTRYARILQRITMGKVIKTCNNNPENINSLLPCTVQNHV